MPAWPPAPLPRCVHKTVAVRDHYTPRLSQIRTQVNVCTVTVGRSEQVFRYRLAHLFVRKYKRVGPSGEVALMFLSPGDKTHPVRAAEGHFGAAMASR